MGKPAARIFDPHLCPRMNPGPVPHVGGPILPFGCPTVLIGNRPAARKGDRAFCIGPPDTISQGSTNVKIGGKPAARMGDATAHGGRIVFGCFTVMIGGGGGGGSGGGSDNSCIADWVTPGEKQNEAMSEAKKNGDPFVEAKDVPESSDGKPSWEVSREEDIETWSNDKSVEVSLQGKVKWEEGEDTLKHWGDDDNFAKLGESSWEYSSSIKVTEDGFEANLIKAKGEYKAFHAQGKLGTENASVKGEVEVLSASGELQVGIERKGEEVFAGAKMGGELNIAKVSGEAKLEIPLLFGKKLVIGLSGEAAVGASAKLEAGVGRNKEFGSYVGFKLKLVAGLGLGGNFTLGIK